MRLIERPNVGSDGHEMPPPPDPDNELEPDSSDTSAVTNGMPAEPPLVVRQLLEISDASPRDLARAALGGEEPDEIVPTAEGITFFRGERSQQHKESGASKSLLELRLDRIKKRSQPGP